jgi:hypothetical protein
MQPASRAGKASKQGRCHLKLMMSLVVCGVLGFRVRGEPYYLNP